MSNIFLMDQSSNVLENILSFSLFPQQEPLNFESYSSFTQDQPPSNSTIYTVRIRNANHHNNFRLKFFPLYQNFEAMMTNEGLLFYILTCPYRLNTLLKSQHQDILCSSILFKNLQLNVRPEGFESKFLRNQKNSKVVLTVGGINLLFQILTCNICSLTWQTPEIS